jgi:hypothetical protein
LPLFVLLTATALLPGRTPATGEGGEVPGSQQGREVRRGGGGKAAGKGGARSERGRRCAQRAEVEEETECGVHLSASGKGTI